MKSFNDIKQLMEDYGSLGTNNVGADHMSAISQDKGTHNVELESEVHRINVFLNNYFKEGCLDTVQKFNQLRAKLNIVGLDFKIDNNLIQTEGSFEFPVTKHGGSFGTTPDHDLSKGFYRDDGIRGMSMSLRGEVEKQDTGYNVNVRLESVPAKDIDFERPEPVVRDNE
tara:strand:- start:784 stop:1290 length:507 start_codon:yes stop_codon:yes gene_type:complete